MIFGSFLFPVEFKEDSPSEVDFLRCWNKLVSKVFCDFLDGFDFLGL